MNANEHDARLEEAAAFALGALDAERVDDFERHLEGCERCQEELRWLAPAVRTLPEAVAQQAPPPELKKRLMDEVRTDARRERAAEGSGFGEWLRGLRVGGMTWKPLAGLAAAVLIVAAGIGYAVGSGGGSGNTHTWEGEQANGIQASVVREGERGQLHLADVEPLPQGKVLEAWVEREGTVEAVPALFAPDQAGEASTEIEDMKGVSAVMVTKEPAGGSRQPTSEPIVEVPLES
ncbi:MAG TPA: anti-sigma factor [Solirubrobacterales bacterium]|nr:anti-sigma factor [Solirubrobacterales bacterium]